MRSKAIISLILLGLLALNLLSCRWNKQERRLKRDSETIEKIRGRSPELFADKSDTTQTQDSIEVGVTLTADSLRVRELLDQYLALDSARHINHQDKDIDLEQKALRQQIFINRQRDIEREIPKVAFKKKVEEFNGDKYNLKVTFDPNAKQQITLSGTTDYMVINKERTIFQKEYIYVKPTTKQILMHLWPWWTGGGLALIIYIAFKILTR